MASIDRLSELRGKGYYNDEDESDPRTKNSELSQHIEKYNSIKKSLETIEKNTDQIEKLKIKNKKAATEKDRRAIMDNMDKMVDSTNAEFKLIRKKMLILKEENNEYVTKHGTDSALSQSRRNFEQLYIRKLHGVMTEHNTSVKEFKNELNSRYRREIKHIDSTLSDEKIDDMIEKDQVQEFMKESLISDSLQETVRCIEERHLEILKLERQVLEIHELFRDLQALVDLQQESLDVIEKHIIESKNYTEKGEVAINEASDYQNKARARQCCCLMIVLAVLIAILAPVLLKTMGTA
jgi:syntaxin 1B/2/3